MLKRLLWHRPRDDVAGATGQGVVDEKIVELEASPASATPSCYTGSKLSETVHVNVDNDTGSLEWVGSGLDSISCLRFSPVGVTTYTEKWRPPITVPACHTCSKLSKTANLKVNIFASNTGNFDLANCDLESYLGKSLANATTSTAREDLQPFLLICATPSCCMISKMSETANLNVDSETGSLESMGSGLDSTSCLRVSSIGRINATEGGPFVENWPNVSMRPGGPFVENWPAVSVRPGGPFVKNWSDVSMRLGCPFVENWPYVSMRPVDLFVENWPDVSVGLGGPYSRGCHKTENKCAPTSSLRVRVTGKQ